MKILLFAPAFAPYMGSESLVTSKLVLVLRQAGCEVDVFTRREFELYTNHWELPWTELQNCTQELVPPSRPRRLLLLERIANALALGYPVAGLRWASLAVARGRKMLTEKRYDVLLSRSPPEIGHLPALILARETGLPWVANWNDPPMGAWPAPYENGNPMVQWVHGRLARQVLQNASVSTFPSERLAQHICRHFDFTPPSTPAIIPHAALPNLPTAPARERNDVFRLCHAGKLCNARDPRPFLDGVRQFLASERPPSGGFLLEQIGHADRDLQVLSREYGIEGAVHSTGPMAYLATMQRLAQSDVNVLVEAPCQEGIFLPGKIVDYSQTSRPILAVSPRNGTVNDLIQNQGGGIAADTCSAESVADALTKLYQSWKMDQLEKTYCSTDLGRPFQPKAIVDCYRTIFQQLGVFW